MLSYRTMLLQLVTLISVTLIVPSISQSDLAASYLCAQPESMTVDEEFDVDLSQFDLKGISVVFRHGERSASMDTINNDCGVRNKLEKEWKQYKKVVNSKQFLHFLHVDDRLSDFKWLPEDTLCGFGQLTAEGALSHRTLGRLLARKYAKIIKEDTVIDIQSTPFNRTLQSGIALISEMLYGRVPTVNIQYTENSMFCNKPECRCTWRRPLFNFYRAQYMEYLTNNGSDLIRNYVNSLTQITEFKELNNPCKLYDLLVGKYLCRNKPLPCGDGYPVCVTGSKLVEQYMEYLTNNGSDLIRNYVNSLTQITEFKELNNPCKLYDLLVGKYLCRNKPLPCGDGYPVCVTGSKLVEFFEDINSGIKGVFYTHDGYLSNKIFHMHAYGTLSTIETFIKSVEKSEDNHHIQLLSAHDLTLGTLMRTLNMTDFYDFPTYNSRAIFEIYRSKSAESELFVRLVYNGKQRRMRAVCPDEYMCSWSKFKQFIENVPRIVDPVLDIPSFCSTLGPFERTGLENGNSVIYKPYLSMSLSFSPVIVVLFIFLVELGLF